MLCKVLYMATEYKKYTRALTFETVCLRGDACAEFR
jgi:hypothetical protein